MVLRGFRRSYRLRLLSKMSWYFWRGFAGCYGVWAGGHKAFHGVPYGPYQIFMAVYKSFHSLELPQRVLARVLWLFRRKVYLFFFCFHRKQLRVSVLSVTAVHGLCLQGFKGFR